ncbi:NAD(P)/FAD-dependent oxidoreductase [Parafrankia elaeagni]|uniref:NAD(P)/FAD-dependent oxidoreductase n=1 Tax=Parafrankia elaeagni TaxID=222534 RepID=UPI00037868A0|nr:FAD-dependent oxidoreductase [Parafrankia elaeagni]
MTYSAVGPAGPLSSTESCVIIGTGVAGVSAAFGLRSAGFEGRVVLVGGESHVPYLRPPLSKDVLRGETPPERQLLRPLTLFTRRQIELRTGVQAVAIDPVARLVRLDDGDCLRYGRLLLATGGKARTLPQADGVAGVFTLRSRDDAVALRDALATRPRVLVVGAGFIGAEVAASARTLGCEVTVIEAASTPMSRVLPPSVAAIYRDIHRSHGVDLRTGVGLHGLERTGATTVATGTDGTRIEAEVVVLGIGMVPDTDLAERAGAVVADGIIVDEHCATSIPGVFAAGDVARAPRPRFGGTHRPEQWQHAQHQGASAARAMLGYQEKVTEVPWCWSDQYDVNLQICGWPSFDDRVRVRGDLDALDGIAIFDRGGVVTGAVGINRSDDVRALRRLIRDGTTADPAVLVDPSTDLAALTGA